MFAYSAVRSILDCNSSDTSQQYAFIYINTYCIADLYATASSYTSDIRS